VTDKRDATILIVGDMHPHALKMLEGRFRVERLGADGVPDKGIAGKIEGIAVWGAADAALIDALPALEIIASLGVGYDLVDARHAAARGVMVTNTPDVLTEEVADTTIALLLTTLRELYFAEKWLREGRWEKEGPYPLTRGTLRGRRIGIFGLGRIGLAVARRLEGFGVSIAYHNRRRVEGVPYAYFDTLEELAEAVDTLISIAPGSPSTDGAVNARVLKALGSDGVLVNIGRGSVVDEKALISALSDGTIMAAGLDVFVQEPHVPAELIALPNATLWPHVGSASVATRQAMAQLCAENLLSWFDEGRALTPVAETAGIKPSR
jgi:lactate dehydrogenase-like 2-hydroxyacid dehydrogenase